MSRQVRTSPGAAYDLGYHVVCPQYRRRVLNGQVKARLEELIRAKAAEPDWEIIALEVMPDHVHLFVGPHQKHSPSYVANQFKGFASHHLRRVPAPARPASDAVVTLVLCGERGSGQRGERAALHRDPGRACPRQQRGR